VKKVQEAAVDVARKRRRRARREQSATDAGLVLQGDDAHPLANDRPDESAMASLLEQVVVPAFAGLARADVDLWIAAKLDGRRQDHGSGAAGHPAGEAANSQILEYGRSGQTLNRVDGRRSVMGTGRGASSAWADVSQLSEKNALAACEWHVVRPRATREIQHAETQSNGCAALPCILGSSISWP
jgi:hypothetical protein